MRRLMILAVMAAMVAAGCGGDEGCRCTPPPPPPPPTPPPQNSPANVIATLQMAYGERKIDLYRKLFAEDFVFVFNTGIPVDPAHPMPDHWDLADELAAASNMFRDEFVSRVELSSYRLGLLERADSLVYGPRTWKVRVDEVHLEVHTYRENGTPLTYVVDRATEVFIFREEPTKPIDGSPSWYIFRWEDQPIEPEKAERTSWGSIKALFRHATR
jgi:hypothetical protein